MTRRYFSLEQAQGLLPEVTRLVRSARELHDHMERGAAKVHLQVGERRHAVADDHGAGGGVP